MKSLRPAAHMPEQKEVNASFWRLRRMGGERLDNVPGTLKRHKVVNFTRSLAFPTPRFSGPHSSRAARSLSSPTAAAVIVVVAAAAVVVDVADQMQKEPWQSEGTLTSAVCL